MNSKTITVIGQVDNDDKMTTEAFYRLFKLLKPITKGMNFISINFVPESHRLIGGVSVFPTVGVRNTLKVISKVKSDIYMFWYGGNKTMVLPILFVKLVRRKSKSIVRVDGTGSRYYRESSGIKKKVLFLIHLAMELLVFQSADIITYQYINLPKDCKMERYMKKMEVSRQYVNTDIFKNTKQYNERYFDLVFCGRFDSNKGVMELVESLNYLTNTLKRKLQVMLIGDGELRQKVRDYIIDHKLYDVNFTGYVSQEEVARMVSNSKCIVIPSHMEGVPKVVLEAMACGTIVISSKAGGLKYLVEDGKTGFIIETIDTKGISDAILKAIDCPIGKRIEILNRYQSVLVDYSYDAVQNRYRQILNGT